MRASFAPVARYRFVEVYDTLKRAGAVDLIRPSGGLSVLEWPLATPSMPRRFGRGARFAWGPRTYLRARLYLSERGVCALPGAPVTTTRVAYGVFGSQKRLLATLGRRARIVSGLARQQLEARHAPWPLVTS